MCRTRVLHRFSEVFCDIADDILKLFRVINCDKEELAYGFFVCYVKKSDGKTHFIQLLM